MWHTKKHFFKESTKSKIDKKLKLHFEICETIIDLNGRKLHKSAFSNRKLS